MKIIPVIDYMQGQVVLAKSGQRSSYQPVESLLCASANLNDVLKSILSLTDFNTIYIADLDAITSPSYTPTLWRNLSDNFPHIEFWLDVGQHCLHWLTDFGHIRNLRPVIGTEAFNDSDQVQSLLQELSSQQAILSLDYKNNQLLGCRDLINRVKHWPNDVICLSIDQVGKQSGADTSIYQQLRQHIPRSCHVYWGGGMRNLKDIKHAKAIGLDGVLIATALHNQQITQAELDLLMTDDL